MNSVKPSGRPRSPNRRPQFEVLGTATRPMNPTMSPNKEMDSTTYSVFNLKETRYLTYVDIQFLRWYKYHGDPNIVHRGLMEPEEHLSWLTSSARHPLSPAGVDAAIIVRLLNRGLWPLLFEFVASILTMLIRSCSAATVA
jgi:hypothetical protein